MYFYSRYSRMDWIWDIVRLKFGSVHECLDVYHAFEHLSRLGKVLYGEGTAGAETTDRRKNDGVPLASAANCRLLSSFFFRSCDWEWRSGGVVQEHDWSTVEADGSEVEGTSTQPNDDALLTPIQ